MVGDAAYWPMQPEWAVFSHLLGVWAKAGPWQDIQRGECSFVSIRRHKLPAAVEATKLKIFIIGGKSENLSINYRNAHGHQPPRGKKTSRIYSRTRSRCVWRRLVVSPGCRPGLRETMRSALLLLDAPWI